MMLTVVVVVVIITIMIAILIPRDMHQELVISQNIGGQLQVLRKNRSIIEVSYILSDSHGLAKLVEKQGSLLCQAGQGFYLLFCPVLVFVKRDRVIPDLTKMI